VSIAAVAAGGCGRIGYDALPITSTGDAGRDAGAPTDSGVRDSGPGDAAVAEDAAPPQLDAAIDASLPPCDEDPCRLVLPQCGCPGVEMCQRTRRGEAFRECVPPGDVERDGPCTQSIQCVTGHTCVGIGSPDGICSRYCYGSAECGGGGSECTIFTAPSEGVGACTPVCDPVQDTGCPAANGCHLVTAQRVEDDVPVTVTLCGPATGGGPGDPCNLLCAPGNLCLGANCAEVCVVGDASTCTTGATCGPFGSPMVVDGVEYGFCQ
jgi:hypothetical protein